MRDKRAVKFAGLWPQRASLLISITVLIVLTVKLIEATNRDEDDATMLASQWATAAIISGDIHRQAPRPLKKFPRSLNSLQSNSSSITSNSESTTNGSAATIKQRKLQSFSSPSYDIIDNIDEPPESAILRQQIRGRLPGLNTLAKQANNQSIQAELDFINQNGPISALLRTTNATSSAFNHKQKGKNKKTDKQATSVLLKSATRGNSSIDDDIAATNFLIGMLLMANKRLIETRDKATEASGNSTATPAKKQQKQTIKDRTDRSPSASSIAAKQVATPKGVGSEDGKGNSKSGIKTGNSKVATSERGSNSTTTNGNKSQQAATGLAPRNDESATIKQQGDVISVRPGFARGGPGESASTEATHTFAASEETPSLRTDASSSAEKQKQQQQRLKRRQDYGTALEQAQYPGGLILGQPQTLGEGNDILHDHKPLVAQDLLSLRRQQAAYGNPFGGSGSMHPENIFVSRPSLDRRHPLYEHLQRQPPFESAYGQQQQQLGIGQHGQPIVISTENEEQQPESHQPDQPETMPGQRNNVGGSGHPLDWTRQQPPPLLSGPHSLAGGAGDLFNPMRPPMSPEHQLGMGVVSNRIGGQPDGGGDGDGNEPGSHALMNPLQHMLMAAKNQQTAAMAYERRRMEHELELQKRQEQMKKQHEQLVERERQAQLAKQRQQQQSGNSKSDGSERPANDNQIDSGGNESNGDNGGGDNNGGQDGDSSANEGGGEGRGDDQNQQQQNDPDLKSFQNFGDTDFTDLFPPGILSKQEIHEMRKQQEESKQRQEQEEQEEREKRQRGNDQQGEDGGNDGGGEGEGSGEGNEQQQQPSGGEEAGEQTEQQNGSNQTQQGEEATSAAGEKQGQAEATGQKSPATGGDESSNLEGKKEGASGQQQDTSTQASKTEEKETGGETQPVSPANANNQTTTSIEARAGKTRRSHQSVLPAKQQRGHQTLSLMPIGSSYQDNNVKPFLVASAAGYMAPPSSSSLSAGGGSDDSGLHSAPGHGSDRGANNRATANQQHHHEQDMSGQGSRQQQDQFGANEPFLRAYQPLMGIEGNQKRR